jgi:hypothetical protein
MTITLKSLMLYRDYLGKNLETPSIINSIEGFPWREKFTVDYEGQNKM